MSDFARSAIGLDDLSGVPGGLGRGQVIGIVDSGIDETHPDFEGRIQTQVPGVAGGLATDEVGHGTHVAGIAAGDGRASGGKIRGMAPEAGIVSIGIVASDGRSLELPPDIGELLEQARAAGARIVNLSWDKPLASFYDSASMAVDAFVVAHPEVLVVIAAGNEGRATDGFPQLGSIGTPATAKNALTVGASTSPRTGIDLTWGAYDQARFPKAPTADARVAGDTAQVAGLSSRGPTDFQSVKPDLVAPGTVILAPRAKLAAESFFWRSHAEFDGRYAFLNGTSMAAPVVSGAAAVTRAILQERFSLDPSAALLKALLVCSVSTVTGVRPRADQETTGYPDFDAGFGRLDLRATLGEDAPALHLDDVATDSDRALESRPWQGAARRAMNSYRFTVDVPDRPLRAVLAWTDRPGAAVQNAMGLSLTGRKGTAVRGNAAHRWQAVDPAGVDPKFLEARIDRRNNLQIIDLPSAPEDTYTLSVIASNTVFPPQGYGLALIAGRTGDVALL